MSPPHRQSVARISEELDNAVLNATELCAYCRERGLFPE